MTVFTLLPLRDLHLVTNLYSYSNSILGVNVDFLLHLCQYFSNADTVNI
jgi:hypothetical protein